MDETDTHNAKFLDKEAHVLPVEVVQELRGGTDLFWEHAGRAGLVYDAAILAVLQARQAQYQGVTDDIPFEQYGQTFSVSQGEVDFISSLRSVTETVYRRIYCTTSTKNIFLPKCSTSKHSLHSYPNCPTPDTTLCDIGSWALNGDIRKITFDAFYAKIRKRIQRGTFSLTDYFADLGHAVTDEEIVTGKGADRFGKRWTVWDTRLEESVESPVSDDPCSVVFGTVYEEEKPYRGRLAALRKIERMEAYRLGLHRAFRSTEGTNGRSIFVKDGHDFQREAARNRINGPATIGIGRYHRNEVRDIDDALMTERCLTMPWIVVDLDGKSTAANFWAARLIVQQLEAFDVAPESIVVSYTGGKGFHVRIPAGAIGNPILRGQRAARDIVSRFVSLILEPVMLPDSNAKALEFVDGGLFNPTAQVSVVGSQHRKTGRRVVGLTGAEFVRLRNPRAAAFHIEAVADTPSPFELPNPTSVRLAPRLIAAFKEAIAQIEDEQQQGSTYESRGIINAIRDGVAEGESVAEGIDGRNDAANRFALYLLTNDGRSEREAWSELQEWNERNDPPLPLRELRQAFESACGYADRRAVANARDGLPAVAV